MSNRKEREKEKLKTEILNTVIDIASEEGWNEVTIRKVSKRIEYSTIVIYNIFGSKENLFRELKNLGFKKINQCYNDVKIDNNNPKQSIINLSYATIDFFKNNRELYQIMFGVIGLRGVSTSCDASSYSFSASNIVKDQLVKVLKGDSYSLFLNWWAIVHGFISIEFSSPNENGFDDLILHFDSALNHFLR